MADLPGGTVTFLLTDVVGSTELWEQHPEEMDVAHARHNELIRAAIETYGGVVFNTAGDSFCAAFVRCQSALSAAIDAQRALHSGRSPMPRRTAVGPLPVRMGLHTERAIVRDGDYLPPPINHAARVRDLCHGGQILLSSAMSQCVERQLPQGVQLRDLGRHELRGLPPEHLFQAIVDDLDSDFPPLGTRKNGEGAAEARPAGGVEPIMRVYMLGGFRVESAGGVLVEHDWARHQAPASFFKYLLTRRHFRVIKEEAYELFWPDSDQPGNLLRPLLTRLRRVLDSISLNENSGLVVVNERDAVFLRASGAVWVDVSEFEAALAQARGADNPLTLLESADSLYAGHLLPEDQAEDWAVDLQRSLRQKWIDLQISLATLRERDGRHAEAETALHKILRDEPMEERAARELALQLARQGRVGDALRVVDDLARALAQMDAEPSSETAELRDAIAHGQVRTSTSADLSPGGPANFVCSYLFPRPPELVGRDRQLSELYRALDAGRTAAHVVLVEGAAGTGKSTLAGALARRARGTGVLTVAGGCREQMSGAFFGPLQEALSDFLLSQSPRRVTADLGNAAQALSAVVPELRYHLNLPDLPTGSLLLDRPAMFGAVHTYLRALAQQAPILICLEDLHAADEATIQLVDFLLFPRMAQLPMTIVGTYRPEDLAPDHPFVDLRARIERARIVTRVQTQPFDRGQTSRMAAAILGRPTSEGLVDFLFATSEGNPLFVDQLLAELKDGEYVTLDGDSWHLTGEPMRTVPSVIGEIVEQRLRRISGRAQDTLDMAAVLGRTFQHTVLLEAVQPDSEDDLNEDLFEASRASLLEVTGPGYAFSHALVRDAVYSRLIEIQRMRLHSRAGEALERVAGPRADEQAAELAFHFSIAERYQGVREKAIRYSIEAGRRASALSAYRDAREHYGRACDLVRRAGPTTDAATRYDALYGRAYAEHQLALWDPAIASFREALAVAQDPLRRAGLRGSIAFSLQQLGDTDAAMAEADLGLEELVVEPSDGEAAFARLRLQYQKALLLFVRGQFNATLSLGEIMFADASRLRRQRSLSWAHSALGMGFSGLGRIEESIDQYTLALRSAEQSTNKVQMATAHSNLGLQLFRGGEMPAARWELEQAMDLYRESASELRAVLTLYALGRVALAEGRLEEAETRAARTLALAREAHDRWEAECQDLFGAIHCARADWNRAAESFRTALDIRVRVGHAAGTVDSLVGLGLVSERSGDFQSARREYERALDATSLMDPCPQTVAAARHAGRALLRLGVDGGSDHIVRALELARSMPRSLELAPTTLVYAWSQWRAGDLESARSSAEAASECARTAEHEVIIRLFSALLLSALGESDAATEQAAEGSERAAQLGMAYLSGLAERAALSTHSSREGHRPDYVEAADFAVV